MSFAPVTPPPRYRLSDAVYDQLEKMIAEGTLESGETLPSERDLAQQLGVSRPSLREALLKLASRGLINERATGGYVVANATGPILAEPLAQLMARQSKTVNDIFELRECLESMAVRLAALRANRTDLKHLAAVIDSLEQTYREPSGASAASSLPELDARFHLEVARATHNVVLIHTMQAIFNLIQHSIEKTYEHFDVRDVDLAHLVGQHRTIYEAIAAHDPEAAQQAVLTHLTFIKKNVA
ncbi:FadR/GntR family transcriptional regulator [Pandoraea sp.]|uniref:FadR/GntR family transcriptional regulator n=1 Tax=Pandoraea sp. TaxID=1883445 RepID=UPI001223955C|nr:FadR/GntR family transcriptional regulator [Pandoraea sp.]MDE2289684.1 FadR family transcriptional regulator [Burkholderiales bacterium]MDE2611285.1 FadR family transcriptional regulator [Burkholderiales bacterium]TAL54468.1 MAG: FadR family transcriptional regulator [Pandoraea sp.]TAM17516.1 MAG: FadR family transcriptional regulator [Pandoraea sp.]